MGSVWPAQVRVTGTFDTAEWPCRTPSSDRHMRGATFAEARSIPRRSGRKPLAFVSHKHNDKLIADAFSEWLTTASRRDVRIFRSSDGLREGPSAGQKLTEEIRKAAHGVALQALRRELPGEWNLVPTVMSAR